MDISDEMVIVFEDLQHRLGTKGALEYLRDIIKMQAIIGKKTKEVYGYY